MQEDHPQSLWFRQSVFPLRFPKARPYNLRGLSWGGCGPLLLYSLTTDWALSPHPQWGEVRLSNNLTPREGTEGSKGQGLIHVSIHKLSTSAQPPSQPPEGRKSGHSGTEVGAEAPRWASADSI